jgi:cytochrome c556
MAKGNVPAKSKSTRPEPGTTKALKEVIKQLEEVERAQQVLDAKIEKLEEAIQHVPFIGPVPFRGSHKRKK